ncbi:M16 family metallopeptidase [Hwanghaeella sp.]|uniref:M16 family metallopeptidase n=1 Tax=Hwanghaeella sp. TaxID=2605943 RepID=UPI003CCBAEC6
MRPRYLLAAFVAGLALSALSIRAEAAVFDPETATLSNGMEVVVVSKRSAPVITHMVWYKVGAMDEPQGKSGLAHFLEHLMFKGTENIPSGQFSEIVAKNGGQDNAFTSSDYTAYYQAIAADRLELVMKLESDRMRNLKLDPEEIETERQVILEERRSRTENRPGARLAEQADAAFYLNHPYGRPIIGWAHEIRGLTPQDIIDFYDRWYAPNNAVLVVVGDVAMADVLPLAEKYYGSLPVRDVPKPIDWREPPHQAEGTVVLRDRDVTQPSWSKRYLAPSYLYGATEHAYPLQVLVEVLSGGTTSRLYSSLVVEDKVAASAGAWYSADSRGPSTLGFYVSPAPGKTLDEASAAMEATVSDIIRDGVTEDEVQRAIIRLTDAAELAKDSFQGIARTLGAAVTIGRTAEDVEAWPERIAAVTVDQVNQAMRFVLQEKGALVSKLLPANAPTQEAQANGKGKS